MVRPDAANDEESFRLLSDDEFRSLEPEEQVCYLQRALKLQDDIRQQLHRLATTRIPVATT